MAMSWEWRALCRLGLSYASPPAFRAHIVYWIVMHGSAVLGGCNSRCTFIGILQVTNGSMGDEDEDEEQDQEDEDSDQA